MNSFVNYKSLISNILIEDFILYTQRICSELKIKITKLSFSKDYGKSDLPENILNGKPIILPLKIKTDIPCNGKITRVC